MGQRGCRHRSTATPLLLLGTINGQRFKLRETSPSLLVQLVHLCIIICAFCFCLKAMKCKSHIFHVFYLNFTGQILNAYLWI